MYLVVSDAFSDQILWIKNEMHCAEYQMNKKHKYKR